MSDVAWSTALLRLLKAPETPANYRFVNAWANREHGSQGLNDGSNNPFFTTAGGSATVGPIKAGTADSWNSFGPNNAYHVAKYKSLNAGVYANALHIQTSFPSILAALRSGNPQAYANNQGFQHELSSWSGSGYSSIAASGGAAGPTGPTVNPSNLGKDIVSQFGGKGVGSAINSVARHVPGVAQVEGAASATTDAAGAVVGFFGKITDPHNILRGLQIVAGAGMVVIGGTLLAKQVALAADVPAVVSNVVPAARVASKAAGAVASQTPARREGRRIEDASDRPRAARQGVARRTESISADTGKTRAQERSERAAARDSDPYGDVPF